jgi:uncharacterized SAM-binding protein YcdF (DUF218 family)
MPSDSKQPLWLRWLFGLLVLCAVALALALFGEPLLKGMARTWIVNEPLAKADAVIVLRGGLQDRPFEAARLYREGFAPRVLIVGFKPSPTDQMGFTRRENEVVKQVLLKRGVPEAAITEIGGNVSSSVGESQAVREWVTTNRFKRVIIPTEMFQTRRVRWLFGKQMAAAGASIVVEAIEPREYSAAAWWRHEEGLIAFQSEVTRWLYERVKYRGEIRLDREPRGRGTAARQTDGAGKE